MVVCSLVFDFMYDFKKLSLNVTRKLQTDEVGINKILPRVKGKPDQDNRRKIRQRCERKKWRACFCPNSYCPTVDYLADRGSFSKLKFIATYFAVNKVHLVQKYVWS
jgi:hypothetical protein